MIDKITYIIDRKLGILWQTIVKTEETRFLSKIDKIKCSNSKFVKLAVDQQLQNNATTSPSNLSVGSSSGETNHPPAQLSIERLRLRWMQLGVISGHTLPSLMK